jgi:hypothetical protein
LNENSNFRWLLVLGMHRSGTSAITRGLLCLGVGLGKELMEPVPEVNAKGFWEDIDIYRLDDEMLHALDTEWNQATPLTSAQFEFLRNNGFLQRGRELLQQKSLKAPVFGFKDPRLCRLLAFWQEALAERQEGVAYVLALRNPMSIADSLHKRDGMDRTKSYLLWLSHTINAVALTEDCPRVLVDFDRMLQNPYRELERMATALGLSIDEDSASKYIQEFLDKNLRHSQYRLSDLTADPDCPALVVTVYRTLRKVAMDGYDWQTPTFAKQLRR